MNSISRIWISALMTCVALAAGCSREPTQVSYANEVAPLMEKYCQSCHVPGQIGYDASGFEIRDHASLMKGTKYGAVVIAGDPMTSALVMMLEGRAAP